MKKRYIIVFVAFFILSLIVGSQHEPWADEAQSWLIARDASVVEIIWDITRYEGCFPLWYLILKGFITLGLSYEYFFIVPIIISSLGLIVFLSSKKVPDFIKILLPFSYFIFYQYTIIARNYCLLFLCFSLLLITYDTRLEKPKRYILNLILFSFISLHGMLISGIMSIKYFLEVIKKKKYKNLYSIVFICFVWIFEIILLIPRSDIYININAINNWLDVFWGILNNIFLYNSKKIYIIQNIITFVLFLVIIGYSVKCKENKTFVILGISMIIFFIIVRLNAHHLGIFYLIMIFGIILNYDKIASNNKKIIKLMMIMLILYNIHTIQASYNDLKYNYCSSEQMAEYIENNIDYKSNNIYTIDYYTTAILPYFDENIFSIDRRCFYEWSTNNNIYYQYCEFDKYKDEILKKMLYESDYILIDSKINERKIEIRNVIESSHLFELEYETKGKNFYKNYYSELQGFLLYKKISK